MVYLLEFDRRKVRTISRKDTHRLYEEGTIISLMLDDSESFDLENYGRQDGKFREDPLRATVE